MYILLSGALTYSGLRFDHTLRNPWHRNLFMSFEYPENPPYTRMYHTHKHFDFRMSLGRGYAE